jgi:hypothetical protein
LWIHVLHPLLVELHLLNIAWFRGLQSLETEVIHFKEALDTNIRTRFSILSRTSVVLMCITLHLHLAVLVVHFKNMIHPYSSWLKITLERIKHLSIILEHFFYCNNHCDIRLAIKNIQCNVVWMYSVLVTPTLHLIEEAVAVILGMPSHIKDKLDIAEEFHFHEVSSMTNDVNIIVPSRTVVHNN